MPFANRGLQCPGVTTSGFRFSEENKEGYVQLLESKTIDIERIKVQQKMNAPRLVEMRATDEDFESRMGERKALQEQLNGLNERLILAHQTEDQEAQAAMSRHSDTTGWTPELRELHEVASRTSFHDYFESVVHELPLKGAAREYSEHVFTRWSPGEFPLEMLLDRDEPWTPKDYNSFVKSSKEDEERAEITGVAADAGNLTWAMRLFGMGEAAYMGAQMPAVGPGRHSYPIISGTTAAAAIARGTAEAPAGGLSITNADPERIQHSYEYSAVDEVQMPGIANALASDLRDSLMAGLDAKVIADLITTFGTNVTPAATAVIETLSNFLGRFGLVVDGKVAYDVRDVRALIGTIDTSGVSSYTILAASSIANVAHWFTMPDGFHSTVRGSAHIPIAASGNQNVLFYGMRGPSRLMVPIWRRGQLLRDTGRLQLNNEVTLTGVMYADVILVNSDPYRRGTIHIN